MLLQDGWKAAATGDWHNKAQALNLPSGLLDRPEMHLKALCFHASLWDKGLHKISHSGSAAYYEMLLKETTLSAVNDFSLEQCKEFAFERKRKRPAHGRSAARPEQGILRLSLDLPSLAAVPCRVPGMEDLQVHVDNWTHSSGHRRGFIQCTRHAKCRFGAKRDTDSRTTASMLHLTQTLLLWPDEREAAAGCVNQFPKGGGLGGGVLKEMFLLRADRCKHACSKLSFFP